MFLRYLHRQSQPLIKQLKMKREIIVTFEEGVYCEKSIILDQANEKTEG